MICKQCWQVFTQNLFYLFTQMCRPEEMEYWRIRHGQKASDYFHLPFPYRCKADQERLERSTIYFAVSSELTQEQFDFIRQNRETLFIIGVRKEWKDERGFSHVEYL